MVSNETMAPQFGGLIFHIDNMLIFIYSKIFSNKVFTRIYSNLNEYILSRYRMAFYNCKSFFRKVSISLV